MPSDPTSHVATSGNRRLALGAISAAAFLILARVLNARVPRPRFPADPPPGRLHACPESPNCVSSQSDNSAARVEPLQFSGDPLAVPQRLRSLLANFRGAVVVDATHDSVHATFRTQWLGFVDDVDFIVDPAARVIHVRSASRIGYSDLGANRRRVEAIRQKWEATDRDSDRTSAPPNPVQ